MKIKLFGVTLVISMTVLGGMYLSMCREALRSRIRIREAKAWERRQRRDGTR